MSIVSRLDIGVRELVGISVGGLVLGWIILYLWRLTVIFGLFGIGISLVAVATWIEVRSS